MKRSYAVLDKGSIELDDHCASDLSVVNAARVSLNKKSEVLDERGINLINTLMQNGHGTPFEHNYFRFRVKAPLFVFREWHRHRIGHSYNEWSARYSKLDPEFYIPSEVRIQSGSPMSYSFLPAAPELADSFREYLQSHSEGAFANYDDALKAGVAKEQARFFLPVNVYSQMIWSCNARSLMHFLSLRNAPSAMAEIRQYAYCAEEIFNMLMPVTHTAFVKAGRKAP